MLSKESELKNYEYKLLIVVRVRYFVCTLVYIDERKQNIGRNSAETSTREKFEKINCRQTKIENRDIIGNSYSSGKIGLLVGSVIKIPT